VYCNEYKWCFAYFLDMNDDHRYSYTQQYNQGQRRVVSPLNLKGAAFFYLLAWYGITGALWPFFVQFLVEKHYYLDCSTACSLDRNFPHLSVWHFNIPCKNTQAENKHPDGYSKGPASLGKHVCWLAVQKKTKSELLKFDKWWPIAECK